ncbi:disease resistance protein RPS2-like [Magnolia sinica]|uniref:disease resistance protein RPS2-like n=1 Tax=Magnolia sinica TaxID=86752 RepID=UPI002659830D|nr:disease resistance protein RPS2-like [Magnolia sinica]
MESLGPVIQTITLIWAPLSRQIDYLKDLDSNMASLISEMTKLKCKREDIQTDIQAAVRAGQRTTKQVENWVEKVLNIESEVDSIVAEFNQRRQRLNRFHRIVVLRYKLSRRVAKMLRDVKYLSAEGVFDKVGTSPLLPMVIEMPTASTDGQTTSEQTLEEIRRYLHDEENRIICVYGMGGVGKTTLMKNINNQLIGTQDFDAVIWVTVSKDLNLGRIQEQIGSKLGLNFQNDDHEWWRCMELLGKLRKMRYLLILDDVWQGIVLEEIGVPKPNAQNRSKIVLTTRFIGVSNEMEADVQVRVKTLSVQESWNLFHEKACKAVLLPDIQSLAMEVVNECGGLPLAITTVGRAMRGKKKKELWINAVRALRGSVPDIEGMEPKVFLPLKLSYDHLQDDKIRACFLYCSLFPEDYNIEVDELVIYWAMEGFIDIVDSLQDASSQGHQILERLKDACLLEASSEVEDHVKMHDLIRDLALWITSSPSNEGPKFLVRAGLGLMDSPDEAMWKEAEKISLMNNKIEELPVQPNCPNLVSFYIRENPLLRAIPDSFFELMPRLQVLDLSHTWIVSLPMSLTSLVNLRALILKCCKSLVEVPPLGQLKELQFLDLSFTTIRNLPEGLENLVKLKQLNLSFLGRVTVIPSNIISKLSSLEDLRMFGTYVNWAKEWWIDDASEAMLGEVATLRRLMSLEITIQNMDCLAHDVIKWQWPTLKKFRFYLGRGKHDSPSSCDKLVYIVGLACVSFPHGIGAMLNHTEALILENCRWLRHTPQLGGDLRNLRELYIFKCFGMDCLVDWTEVGEDALQCLETLHLNSLPNLKKVFDGQMPCGGLRKLRLLHVSCCNKLKSLFSSSMAEQLNQLEELRVTDCEKMAVIIEGEALFDNALSNLHDLRLGGLAKLTGICDHMVDLASLQHIAVCDCPRLMKLPSCYGIQKIMGEKEWWEALEWEDESTKSFFRDRFYRSVWVR